MRLPDPSRLPDLPVRAVLGEVTDALAAHGNAVLVAPPGTGKTTLVPLALASADRGPGPGAGRRTTPVGHARGRSPDGVAARRTGRGDRRLRGARRLPPVGPHPHRGGDLRAVAAQADDGPGAGRRAHGAARRMSRAASRRGPAARAAARRARRAAPGPAAAGDLGHGGHGPARRAARGGTGVAGRGADVRGGDPARPARPRRAHRGLRGPRGADRAAGGRRRRARLPARRAGDPPHGHAARRAPTWPTSTCSRCTAGCAPPSRTWRWHPGRGDGWCCRRRWRSRA